MAPGIGKGDGLAAEPVQVGGFHRAVGQDGIPPLVVGHKYDDIRTFLLIHMAFLPFGISLSAGCRADRANQPFTEPIITPLTKYFCTKG